MKQSKNAAFGGVFIALSVAFLYLAILAPFFRLGFCGLAGVFLSVNLARGYRNTAALVYIATAVLAMILLPVKSAALLYIFFFGLYPFVKCFLEGKIRRCLQWPMKLLFCNLLTYLYAKLAWLMFSENFVGFDSFKQNCGWYLTFLAINIAFILYDIVFSKVTFFLIQRIRH